MLSVVSDSHAARESLATGALGAAPVRQRHGSAPRSGLRRCRRRKRPLRDRLQRRAAASAAVQHALQRAERGGRQARERRRQMCERLSQAGQARRRRARQQARPRWLQAQDAGLRRSFSVTYSA